MSSILKVDTIQTTAGATPTAKDLGLNVAGSVVQIGHTYNHQVSAHQSIASSSLVGAGVTCVITPKSTDNKFIFSWNVSMAYGQTGSYVAGAMKYKIGTGSYVFVDGASDSSVPYHLGYSHSGNQYGPMTAWGEVDITSTSAYTFEPHYRTQTGVTGHWCHTRASYSLLVMEIAQ